MAPNSCEASTCPTGVDCYLNYVRQVCVDDYDYDSYCQFIVIDGLPDGTYDLVADENAGRYVSCSASNDAQCRYDGRVYDNATVMSIQISGTTVTPLSPTIAASSTAIGPGSSWVAGAPAVATLEVGTYDLFYVAVDGRLYHLAQGTDGVWPSGNK